MKQPPSHSASFIPRGHRGADVRIDYRAGGVQDVDGVAGLVHAVYGGDLTAWCTRMGRGLARDEYCLVVAYHEEAAVGYGKADVRKPVGDQDPAPAGHYLSGLVVLPAWRRCGIGDELTRRRLRWVWSRQQSAYFFTNARNQASLALHEHLGFKEIGRAASYLGVPFDGGVGVLMRAERRSGPTSQYPTPQTAIHHWCIKSALSAPEADVWAAQLAT